jgi:hypothetical protein
MDDEDDRYGLPTHRCKYCRVYFPATWKWDVKEKEKYLHVDLLLNSPEAVAAVEYGCEIYVWFVCFKHHADREISNQGKMELTPKENWEGFVERNITLRLSEPAEILPAISAIAEATCNVLPNTLPDDYKAGLCRQHMPSNLLWSVESGQRKPRTPYRASPWS